MKSSPASEFELFDLPVTPEDSEALRRHRPGGFDSFAEALAWIESIGPLPAACNLREPEQGPEFTLED